MKKLAASAVKIAISALLLWIVFRRLDLAEMKTTFTQVSLGLFVLSVGLYVSGQFLSAYRWKVLVAPLAIPVTYSRLAAFYFLGMFFNFFFPTMIGGDAVKLYYLARETGQATKSAASVFMDRNTGLFGLLLVATVVSALGDVAFDDLKLVYPLVGLMLAYLIANVLLFSDPTYRLLARIFTRLKLKRLVEMTATFHESFTVYRRSRKQIAAAVVISIVFDFALIGLNYVNAQAVGAAVAFKYFCVFIPVISFISMLPVTMYGLGLREYSFVVFFSQLGLSRETSLLIALLWFFITVFASLPGAVIYVAYRRKQKNRP
jgi:hypothetical protein